MFNFIHRNAVKIYQRQIANLSADLAKRDTREVSDFLICAVWTRAGLQTGGHIKSFKDEVYTSPKLIYTPQLLLDFKELVDIFNKKNLNFQAASMSLWVHSIRAIQNPELKNDINNLWAVLINSKTYWNDSLLELFEEDKNKIDEKLLDSTFKLSLEILKNIPPMDIAD